MKFNKYFLGTSMSNSKEKTIVMHKTILKNISKALMSSNNPISESPKTKLKQKLVYNQALKFAFIRRISDKF